MNPNLQESSISIRDHRTSKQDKIEDENCEEHNLFLETLLGRNLMGFFNRICVGFQSDFNKKR